jgi:transposase
MLLAYAGKIESLEETIATLKTLIFGARSERAAVVCAEQLALDLEANRANPPPPANDDAPSIPASKARRRARRGATSGRCRRICRAASRSSSRPRRFCPCCAGQMHRFGEDVAEALDRVPARLRVLRTIRPKYACRDCEGSVVQAPAPARLVEGGMATAALIAHIAAAKYAWQSTLYRQAQILAGSGVIVDRQTLARWMSSAAWIAKSLYDQQLKTMHSFGRLFCDETPMPVLDPGRGPTRICQF